MAPFFIEKITQLEKTGLFNSVYIPLGNLKNKILFVFSFYCSFFRVIELGLMNWKMIRINKSNNVQDWKMSYIGNRALFNPIKTQHDTFESEKI